jgi:hypothetical protein
MGNRHAISILQRRCTAATLIMLQNINIVQTWRQAWHLEGGQYSQRGQRGSVLLFSPCSLPLHAALHAACLLLSCHPTMGYTMPTGYTCSIDVIAAQANGVPMAAVLNNAACWAPTLHCFVSCVAGWTADTAICGASWVLLQVVGAAGVGPVILFT